MRMHYVRVLVVPVKNAMAHWVRVLFLNPLTLGKFYPILDQFVRLCQSSIDQSGCHIKNLIERFFQKIQWCNEKAKKWFQWVTVAYSYFFLDKCILIYAHFQGQIKSCDKALVMNGITCLLTTKVWCLLTTKVWWNTFLT